MLLEEGYNYNVLLRMTFENPEEIFQLIKDDIIKENTNPAQAITCCQNCFLSAGEVLVIWL